MPRALLRATPIVGLLLLSGCDLNGRPQSPPWFVDIVPADATIAHARYDSGGTLHLLGVQDDGTLQHGTFQDKGERSIAWGPPLTLEVDGVAYDPYAAQPAVSTSRYRLALRPGSDDVWVWVDGLAGPLADDGTVTVAVQHPAEGQPRSYAGAIAFLDDDTLLLSAKDPAQGIPTLRYGLSGDAPADPAGETVVVLGTADPDGLPLGELCDADAAAGLLHFRVCDDPIVRAYDPANRRLGVPPVDDDDDVLYNPPAMVGVSEDFILGAGLGGTVCVGERAAGGVSTQSTTRYFQEANCYGADARLAVVSGGDVRGDGQQFVVHAGTNALVVLDEKAPRTKNNDLTGAWCDGGEGRVEFLSDRTLILPHWASDASLFETVRWSGSGETLTLDYKTPTGGNFAWDGDVTIKHWARRAGDTLHMKSYVHEKYATDGAGLVTFGGLWVPCE